MPDATARRHHPRGTPSFLARLRAFATARGHSGTRPALWHSAHLFAPDLAGAAGPAATRLIDWEGLAR
ncbi:hypothetical protein [Nocardia sp. NPDC005366]|uniref:hypothetical protein n=1 Tax=Nocardia sp. NPDC005366 TaxID=3156878 RepID=UPI00339E9288